MMAAKLAVASLALLLAMPAVAQKSASDLPAPIFDRHDVLPPSAPTSDDVQRVPMPADDNSPSGSFVLVGGRLFDGTGAAARPATVVVQGKKITAILKPGEKNWPADARIYDVAGKTVMPGLIDLHTHLTYVENADPVAVRSGADAALRGISRMQIFIQAGITSVRDMASNGDAPFLLKQWQSAGRIAGPRVFAAGHLITGTGGHGAGWNNSTVTNPMGAIYEAVGPDGFRQAVRTQFDRGADLIKLASHYSQEEINAAVDEAHALGLPVAVDAETQFIDMAVKAGADCIEHPLPRSDATIALMAKRGIASVPTLVPYRIIVRQSGGYYGNSSRRFTLNETSIVEMFQKLKKAGIKLGVGTDLVYTWSKYLPGAYIDELKSFEQNGYTKSEALVAATKTNAEILRMADKLGTVEPGKLADLNVVNGNPDQDLDALERVETAFVNGRLMLQDGRPYIARHSETPLPKAR